LYYNSQNKGFPAYRGPFEYVRALKSRLVDHHRDPPAIIRAVNCSDVFHPDLKAKHRDKIFKIIHLAPQNIYQILTKRPEAAAQYFAHREVPDNCWLGVSVENKDYVYRIAQLQTIGAFTLFVAFEPLIGFTGNIDLRGINWAYVGGEMGGKKSRRMELDWVMDIKRQCDEQSVPFTFKQWGRWSQAGWDMGYKTSTKLYGREVDEMHIAVKRTQKKMHRLVQFTLKG